MICNECEYLNHTCPECEGKHQCECCDEWYDWEPTPYPDPDSKHSRSTFCSPECADEAADQVRCAEYEDKREFEMWGDDYDSWYR